MVTVWAEGKILMHFPDVRIHWYATETFSCVCNFWNCRPWSAGKTNSNKGFLNKHCKFLFNAMQESAFASRTFWPCYPSFDHSKFDLPPPNKANAYQMRLKRPCHVTLTLSYFMFHLIWFDLIHLICSKDCVDQKEWSMHARANEKVWILLILPDSYWQGLKPEMLPRLKILT